MGHFIVDLAAVNIKFHTLCAFYTLSTVHECVLCCSHTRLIKPHCHTRLTKLIYTSSHFLTSWPLIHVPIHGTLLSKWSIPERKERLISSLLSSISASKMNTSICKHIAYRLWVNRDTKQMHNYQDALRCRTRRFVIWQLICLKNLGYLTCSGYEESPADWKRSWSVIK